MLRVPAKVLSNQLDCCTPIDYRWLAMSWLLMFVAIPGMPFRIPVFWCCAPKLGDLIVGLYSVLTVPYVCLIIHVPYDLRMFVSSCPYILLYCQVPHFMLDYPIGKPLNIPLHLTVGQIAEIHNISSHYWLNHKCRVVKFPCLPFHQFLLVKSEFLLLKVSNLLLVLS